MNLPPHLKELLVKVMTMLLRRLDVPQNEVEDLLEQIDERGVSDMIAAGVYSVQEARKAAREEGRAEGREEGRKEVRTEAENRLKKAINALLSKGNSTKDIADMMDLTTQEIADLLPELA